MQNWKSEKSIFHFNVVWQMESPFLQSWGLVIKKGDRSFIVLHGRFPVYLWFESFSFLGRYKGGAKVWVEENTLRHCLKRVLLTDLQNSFSGRGLRLGKKEVLWGGVIILQELWKWVSLGMGFALVKLVGCSLVPRWTRLSTVLHLVWSGWSCRFYILMGSTAY